jgi:Ca2+-binding EF-hand superfamily protein
MQLTPEKFEELRESFDYNDLDDDGSIEFDEFVNMLNNLEAQVSRDEARIGFRAIDTNKDGVIGLDEFIEWWRAR